jgi:hypothetical protein
MSNELVKKETLPTTVGDGFDVEERSDDFIIGKMIKFKKGDYYINKIEEVPDGLLLVALKAVTVWVKWVGGERVENLVTQPGQHHPKREDLGDLDKEEWEISELSDKPEDPWHDTRYLHLIDPATGMDYTFVTDTHGGRRAVSDLKRQIRNMRRVHVNAVPVISLRWTLMPSKKYGEVLRPDLYVEEWRNLGGQPEPVEPARTLPPTNGAAEEVVEAEAAPFDDDPEIISKPKPRQRLATPPLTIRQPERRPERKPEGRRPERRPEKPPMTKRGVQKLRR